MMVKSLIDKTLERINQEYQPGSLIRIKLNSPENWGKVIGLEQEINEVFFEGDVEKLKKVLESYRELFTMLKGRMTIG
jgi:hypothetical protein